MANELQFFHTQNSDDMWTELATSYSLAGLLGIGNNYNGSDRSYKCAVRFQNITVTGSIDYAGLYYWTQYDGRDESPRDGEWKFVIYGIDEDNTSSFGSAPFGRSKTTAYNNSDNSDEPETGTWKEITVTSAVNEVLTRGGFSSGNAVGLIIEDNGSGKNKYALDQTDKLPVLVIRKTAVSDLTPTPKTVSAPTFRATDSYGLKISYPGYSVLEATEDQTYYTSRKDHFKIVAEGKITTTGGVVYTIAHGQSYKPFARAYFKSISSSKRYKMPRFLPGGQVDPDSDTTDGQIEVDGTNVRILTTDSAEVYYYIYVDELSA